MNKSVTILSIIIFFASSNYAQKLDSITDVRDQKVYKTVTIGDQVWMAENLAYYVEDNCWSFNDDEKNVVEFGYYYKWEVAKNVCPSGWKLPSKNDFETLLNFVSSNNKIAYDALISSGDSGFSAKLFGWRGSYGGFSGLGENTIFWTSSDSRGHYRWGFGIFKEDKNAFLLDDYDSRGFLVRCLKK